MVKEITGDLFAVSNEYYIAHCVSADYALGAGIAKRIESEYNVKDYLLRYGRHKYPDCILVGRVFNLVTKRAYYNKPAMINLIDSLVLMKTIAEQKGIHKIAMPRIGCGLDKLNWDDVRIYIEDIFEDSNIDILVVSNVKLPDIQF